MATLRVRFKLNPGRHGIALGKLSKQTENIELFLRSIAADLGQDDGPNLWQAKDFKNGSVFNTAEYQALVTVEQAVKFNDGVQSLIKFKASPRIKPMDFVTPVTIDRFASLRQGLDPDEKMGIALFEPDTGKLKRWSYVDRLQLEEIGQSIEPELRYVGAIMGRTHEWNKGAQAPYLIVRELHTGELIKCAYNDNDYSKVAKLFSDKSAIVIIEGAMIFNRITSKTEVTMAHDFEMAPDFSDQDFEKFFGCAPNMTGNSSAAEFVAKGRDDG